MKRRKTLNTKELNRLQNFNKLKTYTELMRLWRLSRPKTPSPQTPAAP